MSTDDTSQNFLARTNAQPFKPDLLFSVTLCLTVAISYTAAAAASTKIQRDCGYTSAFMITYANEAFLGISAFVILLCLRMPTQEIWRMFRSQALWALLFAPLALGANATFTAALRLTSVASAVTLEQLTSLFIACLSCCILKARYRLLAIPFLFVAVGGAVLATLGDAASTGISGGTSPLLGDALSLVVAFLAGFYMVLFKLVFPTMTRQELVSFMCWKAAVTVSGGWIFIVIFDKAGWEVPRIPTGCAALWLPVGAVFSSAFNCSLAWATVKITPLTARLSLLLAIPCSFVMDLVSGGHFKILSFFGVLLIFLGVLSFEFLSHRPPAASSETQEIAHDTNAEDGSPL